MGFQAALESVVATLRAGMGEDVDVVDDLRTPEQLSRDRVWVLVTRMLPEDVACPWARTELLVESVSRLTAAAGAESVRGTNELGDAVVAVLESAGIRWTTAEVFVLDDSYRSVRLTVEVRE